MKTAKEILTEAIGPIRLALVGKVTAHQLEWAMKAYAREALEEAAKQAKIKWVTERQGIVSVEKPVVDQESITSIELK